MSAVDDDIRADFLVEAGDLVERLGGQLVELESNPDDSNLLNAIFRAFHTVKGGAGFLAINPLVEICHATEDVFNALRNGKRAVDAALMDAVMQSVDQVQTMMASVSDGAEPEPAPRELMTRLHGLMTSPKPVVAVKVEEPAASDDTISDDEFEALLDQMQAAKKAPVEPEKAEPPGSDTISEDEFDALLDRLALEKKLATAESSTPAGVAAPAAVGTPELPTSAQSAKAKPATTAAAGETSIRVDTQKLDRMMNLVGELVLVRNRLKALGATGGGEIARAVRDLDFITRGLQGTVMQVRMQPVGKVFSRFPKLARDVARGLGKQIEVTLIGQETDLDKNLVEALGDPLMHMVRNSVDHGIEMPDVRVAKGKPAAGQLKLEARQEGDHIRITVRDDGAGIDPERIRNKAVEKGLLTTDAAARLSHDESLQLIFLPGFSTKEQVSDLSGRGVGMDVVNNAILALNGSIHIESQPGHGSAIHLRVPLTLAILPALMVDAGKRQFALPLAMVADVFALDPHSIRKVGSWNVVPLKRENLRLIDLEDWAGAADTTATSGNSRHVVVVMLAEERFGLIVRQVRGREEVVIKPLGASLRGLAGVAGATVTPQGRVALIVDIPGLVRARSRNP
ncbi:MAG: chemotaxis protein CheA [Panacagrimonas sp.]